MICHSAVELQAQNRADCLHICAYLHNIYANRSLQTFLPQSTTQQNISRSKQALASVSAGVVVADAFRTLRAT